MVPFKNENLLNLKCLGLEIPTRGVYEVTLISQLNIVNDNSVKYYLYSMF